MQVPSSTTNLEDAFAEDGSANVDFGALLDEYDYTMPERGQILSGEVLSVGDNEVLVDVGLKHDAFVPRRDLEYLDDETLARITPGSTVMVYVLRPVSQAGDLIVSINKALQAADWERAVELQESQEVIEGEVVGQNKGGILVNFGRLRGFVPQSHVIDIPRGLRGNDLTDYKSEMVGQMLSLKVIEVDAERNRLILSERRARKSVRRKRLEELNVGDTITGRVVNLVDFGAFVDLDGVSGLIHISRLDRQFVNHPSEVLDVDEEVTVRIDHIDLEEETVSLNRAALLPDPWDQIDSFYSKNDLVTGTVANRTQYGLFVALGHGFEGLVHESAMQSYTHALFNESDEVLVRIIEIDKERQRLSLSLDAVTLEEQENWLYERQSDVAEAEVDDAEATAESEEDEASVAVVEVEVEDAEAIAESEEDEALVAEVVAEAEDAEAIAESEEDEAPVAEVEVEVEDAEAIAESEEDEAPVAEVEVEVEDAEVAADAEAETVTEAVGEAGEADEEEEATPEQTDDSE